MRTLGTIWQALQGRSGHQGTTGHLKDNLSVTIPRRVVSAPRVWRQARVSRLGWGSLGDV